MTITEAVKTNIEREFCSEEQASMLADVMGDTLNTCVNYEPKLLVIEYETGIMISGMLSGGGMLSLIEALITNTVSAGCPLPEITMTFVKAVEAGMKEAGNVGHT